MKIILIILTAIQFIGLASSTYLSKSFILGLQDSRNGLSIITILWLVYLIYKYHRKKIKMPLANPYKIQIDLIIGNTKGFIKENWFKLIVVMMFILILVPFYYNSFILSPKREAFSNCLKSYGNKYDDFILEHLRMSPVKLCQKGIQFSDFVDIGRQIRLNKTNEYKIKYADPNNYWIQAQLEKEIDDVMRKEILTRPN